VIDFPARSPVAIGIKSQTALATDPVIHQDIARPAVPAEHRPIGREDGQIGDAADIDDDAGLVGRAENGLVKSRHQRRTLTAGSHITRTEVADHGDAGQLGEQGMVADLQRVPEFRAVADGLAVVADGGDVFCRYAGLGEQGLHGLGAGAAQTIGGERGAVQLVRRRRLQRE